MTIPTTTPPTPTIKQPIAAASNLPVTPFGKLVEGITSVTKEIAENPVHKKGRNTFHNYGFARMQDILGTLTPLMAKHGVVIMQTEIERGFMDNGNAIFATYDFTIMHNSGEVWPFPQRQTGVSNTRTSKGTFDDKGLNKCHTAARKYFLLSLFQIPTTDDEDADKDKPVEHDLITGEIFNEPNTRPEWIEWAKQTRDAVNSLQEPEASAFLKFREDQLNDLAKAYPDLYRRFQSQLKRPPIESKVSIPSLRDEPDRFHSWLGGECAACMDTGSLDALEKTIGPYLNGAFPPDVASAEATIALRRKTLEKKHDPL